MFQRIGSDLRPMVSPPGGRIGIAVLPRGRICRGSVRRLLGVDVVLSYVYSAIIQPKPAAIPMVDPLRVRNLARETLCI